MYALALHTTSPQLGLAISNFEQESRHQTWDLGRDLSTHLHSHLDEFLSPQTWTDLSFLAVAKGPGSFTSTRIGLVTARTLAQQLGIPLFAVSTLEAIAWTARSEHPDFVIPDLAIQMAAQRQEVFAAVYTPAHEHGLTATLPDLAVSLDIWEEKLAAWPTPYQRLEAPVEQGYLAQAVLEIAYQRWQQGDRPTWATAIPFYGQHPVL